MRFSFSHKQSPAKIKDFFSSRFGFIISAAGSAIGLGNIWKFPYVVGKFGGGSFLFVYLIFLFLVGFPTFLAEVSIGKSTGLRPQDAYKKIGQTKWWGYLGLTTIWTGFFISSFYGVVAGWILGYFFEALSGSLQGLHTVTLAHAHYENLMQTPLFGLSYHLIFTCLAGGFLLGGVKRGIELCNRFFMPIFFVILFSVAAWALTLPTAGEVFRFMTTVQGTGFPKAMLLVALGHAFFTLSIGQGTLVTYGSYVKSNDKLIANSVYIVLADTLVSLLAAFSVVSILFYANTELTFGPGLVFETLPAIFSDIPFGHLLCPLFFFLVFIAALTSQISALEPLIAHLQSHHKITRSLAVILTVLASYLLGIPCALSTSSLSGFTVFGENVLQIMNFLTTSVLVPLGGLFAVVLVARKWGVKPLVEELEHDGKSHKPLRVYLGLTLTYIAPVMIFIVFLNAIGWL